MAFAMLLKVLIEKIYYFKHSERQHTKYTKTKSAPSIY